MKITRGVYYKGGSIKPGFPTPVRDNGHYNSNYQVSLSSRAFCFSLSVCSHEWGRFTRHMSLLSHKMILMSAAYFSHRCYQVMIIKWGLKKKSIKNIKNNIATQLQARQKVNAARNHRVRK